MRGRAILESPLRKITKNSPAGDPAGLLLLDQVTQNSAFGPQHLLIVGAIEERNHLGAVADAAHAEFGGRDAVGDAVFDGPCHGGAVELAILHIGEGHLCGPSHR